MIQDYFLIFLNGSRLNPLVINRRLNGMIIIEKER